MIISALTFSFGSEQRINWPGLPLCTQIEHELCDLDDNNGEQEGLSRSGVFDGGIEKQMMTTTTGCSADRFVGKFMKMIAIIRPHKHRAPAVLDFPNNWKNSKDPVLCLNIPSGESFRVLFLTLPGMLHDPMTMTAATRDIWEGQRILELSNWNRIGVSFDGVSQCQARAAKNVHVLNIDFLT